ncbi:chemotaxis protein CheA [Leptospira langatensis]|uniref:histidine kinase n=1 Tax=Leptospira langatensis TaxID=2484983 RepID=A0A5F1ZRQ9_9LEPT|nr:chemotaxis protein CheW [Leptospira langatensis]TGK02606.1 chemotaxis protein CheA [Leptospira langatensis]TGL40193.1 chemotaxis protein CheA [Leptospira langatensis]
MEVDYENLLKDYLVETRELMDIAEESVLELEKEYHPDRMNSLFRAIHTIKGNSAIFNLPSITNLAHSFENLLNIKRKTETKPSSEEISLYLRCLDMLKELNEQQGNVDTKEVDELISKIEGFLLTPETKKEEDAKPAFGFFSLPKKKKTAPIENGDVSFKDGKILIPKRYLEIAEQEHLSLFLVKFLSKGSESKNGSVPVDTLLKFAKILSHGPFVNGSASSDSSNGSHKNVDYALLLHSGERETLLKNSPIRLLSASTIFKFEEKEDRTSSSPVQATQKEEAASNLVSSIVSKQKEMPAETYLKIPLHLLDHMINLAGETIIVRNQLLQRIESYDDPSLLSIVRNLSQLITSSQESVMRTRLQKLETLYKRIPRLIHDLENTTGKEIDLVLEGGEVELDKNIIDSISDPITHMIRNAVDHGIESPKERLAEGKSRRGKVLLSASLRGGNVILKVEDDGKGLSYERIKAKALEKNLFSQEEILRKSQEELSELIFTPGFSTAKSVSSTSGRGVGMDVVKMNFQKAGGTVSITSQEGRGTCVTASLPQTLSIINCQMVRISGMLFAIPQQNISELILTDRKMISYVENKQVYQLRGHLLPLIEMGKELGLSASDSEVTENKYVVVVHTEKHRFGLLVEEIENPEEIVVKPLSKDLAKINLYTGAAILGDGNVALILDISGISKFLKLQANIKDELRSNQLVKDSSKAHYLLFSVGPQLFATDSSLVIRIEQIDPQNFEKILDRELIQYRGEVIELCRLDRYFRIQCKDHASERTMILVHTGKGKKGILVHEIHNVIEEIGAFTKNEDQSSGEIGSGIVSGQTVIVIDPVRMLDEIKNTSSRREITSEQVYE